MYFTLLIMPELAILIPVYNDWLSFQQLIQDIDVATAEKQVHIRVFVVDDGSLDRHPEWQSTLEQLRSIKHIEILHLVYNVGHQRAIAVGLVELFHRDLDYPIVIMDADGEDRPEEIIQLYQKHLEFPDAIIVAKRSRRSEGRIFRLFYAIYKIVFQIAIGINIDFGNFSLIPAQHLRSCVAHPNIWNHFAATIIRSKITLIRVPTIRGKRYHGQSRMNLSSLVMHGLSAISVYSDVTFVRLFIFSSALLVIFIITIVIVVLIRYLTDLAIPGWATTTIGLLFIAIMQTLALSISAVLATLHNRTNAFWNPAETLRKLITQSEVIFADDK